MPGFVAFAANEKRIGLLAYRGPTNARTHATRTGYRDGKGLSVQLRQSLHPCTQT